MLQDISNERSGHGNHPIGDRRLPMPHPEDVNLKCSRNYSAVSRAELAEAVNGRPFLVVPPLSGKEHTERRSG